ncbi:MAG: MBL fold metallo-hydrolase [Candidatus Hodarchaeota archaeon]
MGTKNRNQYSIWIICLLIIFIISISLKSNKQITVSHNIQKYNVESSVESVKITVLIDNYSNGTLYAPWGLSVLVQTSNITILFDTGPDQNTLQGNVEHLRVNVSQLDLVVISHGHADHVEGLSYIAEQNPNITVFVPIDMSSTVKQRINSWDVTMVEIESNYLIKDDIAIIGPLYGPPNEQALAINVKGLGLIIFVGCSHPGVENLAKESVDYFETQPYAVIGGFHTLEEDEEGIRALVDELLSLNLKKICPTHCCGEIIRDYLHNNYPSYYEEISVGYSTTFHEYEVISSSSSSSSSSFEFLFVFGGLISLIVKKRKKTK